MHTLVPMPQPRSRHSVCLPCLRAHLDDACSRHKAPATRPAMILALRRPPHRRSVTPLEGTAACCSTPSCARRADDRHAMIIVHTAKAIREPRNRVERRRFGCPYDDEEKSSTSIRTAHGVTTAGGPLPRRENRDAHVRPPPPAAAVSTRPTTHATRRRSSLAATETGALRRD